MLPSEIFVDKHGQGSYWDHLPSITEQDRLRKQTLQRFISHDAFYRMRKYRKRRRSAGAAVAGDGSGCGRTAGARDAAAPRGGGGGGGGGAPATALARYNPSRQPAGSGGGSTGEPSERQERRGVVSKRADDGKNGRWVQEYERKVSNFLPTADSNNVENCGAAGSMYAPTAGGANGRADDDPSLGPDRPRSATNHEPPSSFLSFCEPRAWRPCSAGRRSNICNVCRRDCRADESLASIGCRFCSGRIHAACFIGDASTPRDVDSFVCEDCRLELDTSRETFEARSEEIEQDTRLHFCVTKVCAQWRSRAAKRRKKKVERAVVFLQSVVRAYMLRQKYKARQRTQCRPFQVSVASGTDLAVADWNNDRADPYVVLTVLDETGRQIWRFDGEPVFNTTNPLFNQTFLIPGCPGTAKLVVTVVDRDDMRDQFMGQCFLTFSTSTGPRLELWKRGCRFRLALDELRYMPKTTSASDVALDAGAVDFTSIKPQGELVLSVHPTDKSRTMCGCLKGHPIDEGTSKAGAVAAAKQIPSSTRQMKYWCVLANHSLHIFKTYGSSSTPMLVIELATYALALRGHRIDLIPENGKERAVSLSCPSKEESKRWKMALRSSFELRNGRAAPPSKTRRRSCNSG